jgi:tetratricopeptide (TPR) repeat protein
VSSRYFFARQYDKAIEEGRNAVSMDPAFAPAHLVLGQAYQQKGMLPEAIVEFEKAAADGGSIYAANLADALAVAGRRPEAATVADELSAQATRGFVPSYDLAIAQLGLGDRDKIFRLLETAVQERSPRTAFLGVDPRFSDLRSDARYHRLLRSMGLH